MLFVFKKMLAIKASIVLMVIFVSSSEGIVFNCRFTNISWNYLPLTYTCEVRVEEVSGNDTALLDVRGTHLSDRTDYDVQGLAVFNHYSYTKIPSGIDGFFPNLTALQFWGGGFTSLSAEDLKPFPNLLLFVVGWNKLVTVNGDLFRYTPQLRTVDFSGNRIETVGIYVLAELTDLKSVDFTSNSCIHNKAVGRTEIEILKTDLVLRCPPTKPEPPQCPFS